MDEDIHCPEKECFAPQMVWYLAYSSSVLQSSGISLEPPIVVRFIMKIPSRVLVSYEQQFLHKHIVWPGKEGILLWRPFSWIAWHVLSCLGDHGSVIKGQNHIPKQSSLYLTNQVLRHQGVWGNGCIDPHFLDLGTSWRWVVSFTHRPLSLRGKSPRYPLHRRLGGPQSRSGRRGEEKILGTPNLTPR
jgi:hypothetical protein